MTIQPMKTNKSLLIPAFAMFALFSSFGSAATIIQVDVGTRVQLTNTTGWNNLTRTDGDFGTPITNLTNMVDSLGTSTGIDLSFSATGTSGSSGISGTGANYGGTYPAPVSSLPTSALRDGMFFNTDAVVTLTLADLDPLKTYNFLLYGARGNNGKGANYAVAGLNSDSGTITDVVNNSTQTVSFTGIQPTALGVITLTLTPTDTSGVVNSNPNSGSLNTIIITAIPEPSSSMLLGSLGALALLRRRRH